MTANIMVSPPYQPFTLPNKFGAVFNGYVWCGVVDKDPQQYPVQVYVVSEDGTRTEVSQPLRTNAGGFLVYNGNPANFVTDSNHSLLVQDSMKGQVWYGPDMSTIDPQTAISILGSQSREALRRSYLESGYTLVNGSFETGGVLSKPNDVMLQESSGKAYSGPSGAVQAGTAPSSGQFIDRSGELLKGRIKRAESYSYMTSMHGCGKSLGAENSLITYTMLADYAEVVDCDISTTSDHVPILLHNLNVDGITSGTGSVFSFTAAQIASQRVLAFDGTPYEGQPLTTWDEFINAASRRGSFVTAELKNTQTPAIHNVISIINAHNMKDRVRLQCLNIARLIDVRSIDPDIMLEILVYDGMPTPSLEAAISKAVELGNCGINVDINYSRLEDAVSQSELAGVKLSAFTASYSTNEMIARKVIGRTQITTDYIGV